MKIVKLLFVLVLVSTMAVSCKETKKEEVQEDAAVEMTEESDAAEEVTEAPPAEAAEEESSEGSGAAAAGAAAAGAAAASSSEGDAVEEAPESVEAEAKAVEVVPVPAAEIEEKLADTPVIYPGCSGSYEEIRACNKENFIAYVKGEFNHDVSREAGLKRGDYKIQVTMHVNKAGRVFASRVVAPHNSLEKEMFRVVNSTPKVTAATHGGKPVVSSLQFLVDFKVEQTQ